MTDKDFKSELELFAGLVEAKKARSILVDVAHFRHNQGPGMQEWRLKNISLRYSAAGVRRFAFLLPKEAPVPPMMNRSSPGVDFLTRGFNSAEKVMAWLTEEVRYDAWLEQCSRSCVSVAAGDDMV